MTGNDAGTITHRMCSPEAAPEFAMGWHLMADAFASYLNQNPAPDLNFETLEQHYSL